MQLKFTDGKLSFCKNNIPVCISYEEIAFLQSRGFATLITCISGKTYTVGIPFRSFAKILSNPEGFLLIRRNILVSMNSIRCFTTRNCYVQGDFLLPVSIRKIKQLELCWRNYDFTRLHHTVCKAKSSTNFIPSYGQNDSVKEILSEYAERMDRQNIHRNWNISFPKSIRITTAELCNMLKNTLETVCQSCFTMPPESRYHNFTICMEHGNSLYMVSSTGTISSDIAKEKEALTYLCATSQKYNGTSRISRFNNELHIDAVIET